MNWRDWIVACDQWKDLAHRSRCGVALRESSKNSLQDVVLSQSYQNSQLLRSQHSLGENIYLTHNSGVPGLQAFFSPWIEQFCDWQMNIYKHHSRAVLKGVLKICSFFFPPVLWGIFQCLHILASIRASPVAPVTWFGTNGAIKHLSRQRETGSTGNCVKTPCGI